MKLTKQGYMPRLIDKEIEEKRNESTICTNNVLIKDIDVNVTDEDFTLSRNTVTDYLNVLNRLHLDLMAFMFYQLLL